MQAIERVIRAGGFFLRRRELLARGYSDARIRAALAAKRIFRVRHGWYSVPDAPPAAVLAVRVGGRLTSVSALESYGLRVPRRDRIHVAVPPTASRLRKPRDRRRRLEVPDAVRVHWIDHRDVDRRARGGTIWRVSLADALLAVLLEEPRDIAIACCGAVMRYRGWSASRLDGVFRRAPRRVQRWRRLVSTFDESHGETFVRLWLADAGIGCVQQPRVPGVGRLDFRLAPHTYVEVDGAQHDPAWTGGGESSWQHDLERDLAMTSRSDRVLRYSYRLLYGHWPRVLAAIERAIADDAALAAYRRRHPYSPRVRQKRRRSAAKAPP